MSRVPGDIARSIEDALGVQLGASAESVAGGDINDARRVTLDGEPAFLKFHGEGSLPGMFPAEAEGLALLGRGPLRVPRVLLATERFLLLEWIEQGRPAARADGDFGEGLAALHQLSAERFGLEQDNYMGSLAQRNPAASTAAEFFRRARLEPMVALGLSTGRLPAGVARRVEALYAKLPELLPDEPPALVHGDLWGGNRIFDSAGASVLIDPAVAFSLREVDLAMTQLFGGFGRRYLEAYDAVFPRAPGAQGREGLINLYPLLVHVVLFGGGYAAQVDGIARRYA